MELENIPTNYENVDKKLENENYMDCLQKNLKKLKKSIKTLEKKIKIVSLSEIIFTVSDREYFSFNSEINLCSISNTQFSNFPSQFQIYYQTPLK